DTCRRQRTEAAGRARYVDSDGRPAVRAGHTARREVDGRTPDQRAAVRGIPQADGHGGDRVEVEGLPGWRRRRHRQTRNNARRVSHLQPEPVWQGTGATGDRGADPRALIAGIARDEGQLARPRSEVARSLRDRIFINYRRKDARGASGRICDWLRIA